MALSCRNRLVASWVERGRSTITDARPSTPGQFQTTASTTTTATLGWTASTSPDQATYPLLGYRIYNEATGALLATLNNPATIATTISSLSVGGIYDFYIVSFSGWGPSFPSPTLRVDLPDNPPAANTPGKPNSISGIALSTSSYRVDFGDPAATLPNGDPAGAATGIHIYRGGTLLVGTLANPALRTFTETSVTATSVNVTVRYFNASGDGPASNIATIVLSNPPASGAVPAVLKPFRGANGANHRVVIGATGPDTAGAASRPCFSINPTGDPARMRGFGSAQTILRGAGPATRRFEHHREFLNSNINGPDLRAESEAADAIGVVPKVSFKDADLGGYLGGSHDARLDELANYAKTRRTANGGNGKPIMASNQHEPAGNAGFTLAEWGRFHSYAALYLAGWTPLHNGTGARDTAVAYNATKDVSDILTWCSINNGFIWMQAARAADLAASEPAVKHTSFALTGAIAMADIYEGFPNGMTNPTVADAGVKFQSSRIGFTAGADRPSRKATTIIDWFRDNAPGVYIGFGEVGTADGLEWTTMWNVCKANRDVCCWVALFNSIANSKWEWRILPWDGSPTSGGGTGMPYPSSGTSAGTYPVFNSKAFDNVGDNGTDYSNEVGGTGFTQERLAACQACVDESLILT